MRLLRVRVTMLQGTEGGNSDADVAELTRLFSFVPPGLLRGSPAFRLGEALVGGKLMPRPAYVRMGERVTQEGGADVPTTWAAPR